MENKGLIYLSISIAFFTVAYFLIESQKIEIKKQEIVKLENEIRKQKESYNYCVKTAAMNAVWISKKMNNRGIDIVMNDLERDKKDCLKIFQAKAFDLSVEADKYNIAKKRTD